MSDYRKLVANWNAAHPDDVPFISWGGDDEAPADWDRGTVLTRGGMLFSGSMPPGSWAAVDYDQWQHDADAYDIIGYRKRATPSADTVKPMTEAEVLDAYDEWLETSGNEHVALHLARHWGLLREETLAERYTRETGKEATPEVIAALEWASKL